MKLEAKKITKLTGMMRADTSEKRKGREWRALSVCECEAAFNVC